MPARTGVRQSTLNWLGDVSLISRYAGRASCARVVGTARAIANRKMTTRQRPCGNSLAKVGRALRSAPEQGGLKRGVALRRARPTAGPFGECFGALPKNWGII